MAPRTRGTGRGRGGSQQTSPNRRNEALQDSGTNDEGVNTSTSGGEQQPSVTLASLTTEDRVALVNEVVAMLQNTQTPQDAQPAQPVNTTPSPPQYLSIDPAERQWRLTDIPELQKLDPESVTHFLSDFRQHEAKVKQLCGTNQANLYRSLTAHVLDELEKLEVEFNSRTAILQKLEEIHKQDQEARKVTLLERIKALN